MWCFLLRKKQEVLFLKFFVKKLNKLVLQKTNAKETNRLETYLHIVKIYIDKDKDIS